MDVFRIYLYHLFSSVLSLYYAGLWIYILSSFIQIDREARWYRFLESLMAPPLNAIRKLTGGRAQIGMFDLSPMILLIGFPFLRQLLAWLLGLS